MGNNLIKDHRSLGMSVVYTDKNNVKTRGVVTGVRRPLGVLFNIKTMEETPNANLVQLRIKPTGGKRAFWTTTMKDKQ